MVGNCCAVDETSFRFDVFRDEPRSVFNEIPSQAVVVQVERIDFTLLYFCFRDVVSEYSFLPREMTGVVFESESTRLRFVDARAFVVAGNDDGA